MGKELDEAIGIKFWNVYDTQIQYVRPQSFC